MIRKSIILLLVSLFMPWVGHGKNLISTAKKAETTQQQQHYMTAKQWEKVHATYALKTYQPKDCWNFITDYSPNDKANEATTRLFQNMKIQLLAQPTLRDKLLFYLHLTQNALHRDSFTLPFTREKLAQFISADRSAVSRELSRMKDEGIIKIEGKTITLN